MRESDVLQAAHAVSDKLTNNPGDEIRLKHPCPNIGAPPWTGSGLVVRLNETSEEVRLLQSLCRPPLRHPSRSPSLIMSQRNRVSQVLR